MTNCCDQIVEDMVRVRNDAVDALTHPPTIQEDWLKIPPAYIEALEWFSDVLERDSGFVHIPGTTVETPTLGELLRRIRIPPDRGFSTFFYREENPQGNSLVALPWSPHPAKPPQVVVNGVQIFSRDWTLQGALLIFNAPLLFGDLVQVHSYGS